MVMFSSPSSSSVGGATAGSGRSATASFPELSLTRYSIRSSSTSRSTRAVTSPSQSSQAR